MIMASLVICTLLVFACGGGTPTPTDGPLPIDTSTPTPTFTPPPTFTPTEEPTITPTTLVGTPVIIRFIQMIDGATGWAIGSETGEDNRVLITQDGGTTWEDVTPPEPDLATKHAVGYFHDRHTGWVVYYPIQPPGPPTPGTFYTWNTTNGGVTWTQSSTHSLEFLSETNYPPYIDFVSASTGWIMLREGGAGMHKYPAYLMKTTDGGASWTIQVTPPDDLFSCRKTGMSFGDANTGWATIDNCPITGVRVEITSDGGASWNTVSLPDSTSHPGLFASHYCWSHSPNLLSATTGAVVISCYSDDPTNVVDYLYVTNTSGASWIDVPYPGGPLYALDSATMFAMGQEMHRSTDGGVNWTLTSSVSWEGQFSFVTPLYVWGAAELDGSYALVKSVNGTSSWAELSPMVVP
jgi:hypothetical protein